MPTRYLKPGICDSETIDRCSPMAECLFYRLLVNVDDFGRIDARPAVVRSRCFPLKDTITNKDVTELLSELHNVGLIHLYNSDGCAYLQMKKWDNAPRASKSKCPSPSDDCIQVHTTVCKPPTILPETVTVTVTKTDTETGTGTPDARDPQKFQMHVNWKPSEEFPTLAKMSMVKLQDGKLGEFVAHWLTRTDQRTQAEWDKALLQSILHDKARGQSPPRMPQREKFEEKDYGKGGKL